MGGCLPPQVETIPSAYGMCSPERIKKTFAGHTAAVKGVTFSPDGQTIISWSNDQTIRLWDVETGEFKKLLKVPKF